jgi:hypothetical protein
MVMKGRVAESHILVRTQMGGALAGTMAGTVSPNCSFLTVLYGHCGLLTAILRLFFACFTLNLRLFYGCFTVGYGYFTLILRIGLRFLPHWRCIRHWPGSTDHPPLVLSLIDRSPPPRVCVCLLFVDVCLAMTRRTYRRPRNS